MAEKALKNNGFIAFLGGAGARAAAFRGQKAVKDNGFLMFSGGPPVASCRRPCRARRGPAPVLAVLGPGGVLVCVCVCVCV